MDVKELLETLVELAEYNINIEKSDEGKLLSVTFKRITKNNEKSD